MHYMQQQLNAGRVGLALPQGAGVLQQRTLPRSQYQPTHPGRTGSRQVAHIAAEPRQILVQDPVQQQGSPTASLSYTSFEDDSLQQSLVTLQEVCLDKEVCRLEQLLQDLSSTCSSLADKVAFLQNYPHVQQLQEVTRFTGVWEAVAKLPLLQQYVLLCLPAIGQGHVLLLQPAGGHWEGPLTSLSEALKRVDTFYDSMGGLVGYQLKSLQLITSAKATAAATAATPAADGCGRQAGAGSDGSAVEDEQAHVTYHVPPGLDLAGEAGSDTGVKAAAQGLLSLPYLSTILPVGGAGDRLGLRCEVTGEGLPAAMLPYCGHSMLEGQVRDLQAQEYLYWHLTGTQVTTPVAIMTSDAKGNHSRISRLLEDSSWFGRTPKSYRLFRQPLVPVVSAEDGRWLVTRPLKFMMKPGGHGAIWKLMHDEGVFDWLQQQGRVAALIRQISNPMAGVDTTLLALAGTGFSARRAFGFMSCERVVGAAEGMNVLREHKVWVDDPSQPEGGRWQYDYAITNVEYTEFERLGISDQPLHEGSSQSAFPANTNILYVGLAAVRAAVDSAIAAGGGEVLPGLIFNLKKKVSFFDPLLQQDRDVRAGRMECTMQNLADALTVRTAERLTATTPAAAAAAAAAAGGSGSSSSAGDVSEELSTFMVYNLRRKVTSSAKKQRSPDSTRIHQTPEGAFYDLQRNAWQVLQRCGMRHVPAVGDVQEYLSSGPGFIFLHHPALGPLWDVIAQKIRGGGLMQGSELVLEVAEARLLDVTVDGSLLVHADNIMGHTDGGSSSVSSSSSSSSGSSGLSSWRANLYNGSSTSSNGHSSHSSSTNNGHSSSHSSTSNGSGHGSSSSSSSIADGSSSIADGSGSSADAADVLTYSCHNGRVHMMNVAVQNVGIDWHHPGNVYWQHKVQRHEACRIILRGRSEFEAYDCKIRGDQVFEVPDGYRMVVTSGPAGKLSVELLRLEGDRPTWEWAYTMEPSGAVGLEFVRNTALDLWSSPLLLARQQQSQQDEEDEVFDWVI